MYPNPLAKQAHGSDYLVLFEFLGRILGKALYEGITIHPQFAHFFLSFLRGDYNYFHMLPDLCTMDAQLYQNLMFLKTYEGDAEDLCLTFTVTNDDFGGNTEIPLIPNGGNVAVTDFNKRRYIGTCHYLRCFDLNTFCRTLRIVYSPSLVNKQKWLPSIMLLIDYENNPKLL